MRDAEVAELAAAFNDMLDRLEAERRDSARRALAAQEDERRRIARELHDEIGQTLTGADAASRGARARRAPTSCATELDELRETARHGAEEVRRIARRLRPEALDELGPAERARWRWRTAFGDQARHRGRAATSSRDLPLDAEEELVDLPRRAGER